MSGGLGSANVTAVIPGSTQLNAGNWTATFQASDIPISLPTYECYHIVISGGPPGSIFHIYVDNNLYDAVSPGDTNSWDPHQTMKLQNGNTISYQWNSGAGTAPVVWMYFQESAVLT